MSGTLPPPPFDDEPYRRPSSMEMTAVIPRDSLPPVSVVPGPTIEQIRDAEKQVDEIERLRLEREDDLDTLVPCEGPCRQCPCCHGERIISAERAAEWNRMHPQGG